MPFQIIKTVSNFPQIAMLSFGNNTKTCVFQIIVNTVKSYNFRRPVIKFVDNLLVISSTDVLDHLLLLLYMMLPGSSECLALEVNIDCLIEAYKLKAAWQNLSTLFVTYIGKMDPYVINLECFHLAHVVSKKKS